jgi:nitrogen regulatory protein P-II 1
MKQSCFKKIRLEVTANDDFLQPTIEAIKRESVSKNEGNVGNGKILMLPLEDISRICTNENGPYTI